MQFGDIGRCLAPLAVLDVVNPSSMNGIWGPIPCGGLLSQSTCIREDLGPVQSSVTDFFDPTS